MDYGTDQSISLQIGLIFPIIFPNMINWINFLHIYQPPEQDEKIFRQVARESYSEIAKFFDSYDGCKITMNASGSLLEQLVFYGYDKLLEDLARAAGRGELEIAGSAMYHPILPLLAESEIERQILLDEKIKKEIFGADYVRRGFYLPEMAYSRRVAEILSGMGFEWVILDEISCRGRLGACDTGKVYRIKGLDLKAVFRDRNVSNSFVPESLSEISSSRRCGEENIVTATDGEIYGHRHRDFYHKTKAVFEDKNIRSRQVSEFVQDFGGGECEEVEPVTSCWETKEEDLRLGMAFSYWEGAENEIQKELWDFANFVSAEVEKHWDDKNYEVARNFADKGFSSCHFWAASGRESFLWKDVIWNPDAIERGNAFFVKAMRSLTDLEVSRRMEAEERYLSIMKKVWSRHWGEFYGG